MAIAHIIVVVLSTTLSISAFQLKFPKIKLIGFSPERVDDNVPKRLIQNGGANELRLCLEKYCGLHQDLSIGSKISLPSSDSLRWEPDLQESYEVADVIFQEIAQVARDWYNFDPNDASPKTGVTRIISCPSMSRPDDLLALAQVLQTEKCKLMLGLESTSAELHPSSPAPYLKLSFTFPSNDDHLDTDTEPISDSDAIYATEKWVDNFLGRYNLCPYTHSTSKAAVGLSSVDVSVGQVRIVVGGKNTALDKRKQYNNLIRASELASSFWSETVTILQSHESQWATSLLLFPMYDNDFESFVDACDNVVQPIVEAISCTDYIGRAWFHPKYNADVVGHSSVIAGHSVPHKMVMKFIIQTINGPRDGITYDDVSNANNKVRMTPHATINILRRSQLNAAAQYEKKLGEKKPVPNSIYVRNTLKIMGIHRERGNDVGQ